MTVHLSQEREITEPVALCQPDGRLDRSSVGWTRRPLHDATHLRRRGRAKRWEYWAVQAPGHVLSVTVSDLDYAALHAVWVLRPDGTEVATTAIEPLGRGVELADRAGQPARARARGLSIDITPTADGGTRLQVRSDRITADVTAARPPGHECLGVVVPWRDRVFQYTVKENTLPATGTVTVDGQTLDFAPPDSWATLDHGRGRWPRRITWNWGSGSGRVPDGRVLGVQVGGRWTDRTGSTENALCLDGRLSKLGADLWWEYDRTDWTAPWRVRDVRDERLDLTLTPFHERADRTDLVVVASEVHQCFGVWSGWVVPDDGERITVEGILGWAEEARQLW